MTLLFLKTVPYDMAWGKPEANYDNNILKIYYKF
jgi:hypothetical protein